MFTVCVNEIDLCIMLCSTVVCTELCTLLLIIVTIKNVQFYVRLYCLLGIVTNKIDDRV